jgi:hypothetical protein
MRGDDYTLTAPEREAGWHWCLAFDGLLVGPGMGELRHCECELGNALAQQAIELAKKQLPPPDDARVLLATDFSR